MLTGYYASATLNPLAMMGGHTVAGGLNTAYNELSDSIEGTDYSMLNPLNLYYTFGDANSWENIGFFLVPPLSRA
ncbi:MAG: hypothetical protein KU38_08765 [Sulfurovum sp. FS08-3]|nr:MAG: hypothetical protein KU38_08765 [Sulfurovum sp. FS08-3]